MKSVSNSNIPPQEKGGGASNLGQTQCGAPLVPPFYFKGKKLRNGLDAGILGGDYFFKPPQPVFVFPVSPV